MTDIKVDTAAIVSRVTKLAQDEIDRAIPTAASGVAKDLLSSGKYYPHKEGIAHELIRKKVEDYVLSDKFLEKIDAIIESSAEEELTRAVRALLNSKARKHLFQPTSPIEDEREYPWIIRNVRNPRDVWDMDQGWVDGSVAGNDPDTFTNEEKNKFILPMDGEWVKQII